MDCDWRTVIATLSGDPPDASPIWYQKHMWHEMTGPIGFDDFTGFTHAFLIREPERMVASYLKMRQAARIEDLGLKQQAEFFERECDRLGHSPPVVDAGLSVDTGSNSIDHLTSDFSITGSATDASGISVMLGRAWRTHRQMIWRWR